MLDFLCEEGRITETFKLRLLGWVHSGFSVHHDVKVKANDAAGQRHDCLPLDDAQEFEAKLSNHARGSVAGTIITTRPR